MKILIFAPHPDDEVLGCGGTIARYIDKGAEVTVCIVTSPQPPVYVFKDNLAEKNGWPHIIYPQINIIDHFSKYGFSYLDRFLLDST